MSKERVADCFASSFSFVRFAQTIEVLDPEKVLEILRDRYVPQVGLWTYLRAVMVETEPAMVPEDVLMTTPTPKSRKKGRRKGNGGGGGGNGNGSQQLL